MKQQNKFVKFNYDLDFKSIDFRKNPELYIIGKGEQGVLLIEPYKSEILPFWRFKTPEIAKLSSLKIYELYEKYKSQNDFVGMDMCRKFLQMGITRSRRYANHKSGKKYVNNPQLETNNDIAKELRANVLPLELDLEKAESAKIFSEFYYKVKEDPDYKKQKLLHIEKYY